MTTATYRAAAVASALSAVTTFLLWFLPRLYASPEGFDATLLLHQNIAYISRLWVNFIHVFLALAAYGGAAMLLWRRSPGLAGFGFLCFLVWGIVELIGVSLNLFAVNFTWRAGFASATPDVQEQVRVLLAWFPVFWDALFFLLLVAFLLGTTCYGLAAVAGRGLERLLGLLFLLAVPLTVAILLGGYASMTVFDGVVEAAYPILQPLSRGVLAAWLWRAARQAVA
jgi:hypothetical protein